MDNIKILKLDPVLKNYIWGGTKLKEDYNKVTSLETVAESWELSCHSNGTNLISDSNIYLNKYLINNPELLGENSKKFDNFPILIKLIDAKDNLSIQVHPSDDYALSNENSYGKTEMWYIVEAENGAGIYLGLNKDVTAKEFEQAMLNNTLTSILNFIPVKKGDCYFIPSGTIHAIGSGCLIYEIQQNSNLTYRVYDYNRKDANGNTRELHVEKAKKVTNLNKFVPTKINATTLKGQVLGISKYFTSTKLELTSPITLSTYNSFCCITCMQGDATIENVIINKGESVFVPASYGKYKVEGNATLILTEVRKYFVKTTNSDISIIDDEQNVIYSERCSSFDNNTISNVLAKVNMTINDIESIIRIWVFTKVTPQ